MARGTIEIDLKWANGKLLSAGGQKPENAKNVRLNMLAGCLMLNFRPVKGWRSGSDRARTSNIGFSAAIGTDCPDLRPANKY